MFKECRWSVIKGNEEDYKVFQHLEKLTRGLGVEREDLYAVLGRALRSRWHIEDGTNLKEKVTCQLEHIIATTELANDVIPPRREDHKLPVRNLSGFRNQLRVAFNVADIPDEVKGMDRGKRLDWFGNESQDVLQPKISPAMYGRAGYIGVANLAISSRNNSLTYDDLAAKVLERFGIQIPAQPSQRSGHFGAPNADSPHTGILTHPRLSFLANPVFLGGVALTALAVILIPGAFYVRGEMAKRGDNHQGTPPSSITVPGPSPGRSSTHAATKPPVTIANLTVKVNTNPYSVSSDNLREIYGRNESWMIPKGTAAKGALGDAYALDGFYKFANRLGGVAVNNLLFSVTVQNLSGGAVFLQNMNVVELKCESPLKGTRIWRGGGADPLKSRVIVIDLNAKRPVPRYYPDIEDLDFKRAKPGSFGFTLSKDETESFDIFASIDKNRRSCQFKLSVDAVVNGNEHQELITDQGRPFNITYGNPVGPYWNYQPGVDQEEGYWALLGESSEPRPSNVPPGRVLPETNP